MLSFHPMHSFLLMLALVVIVAGLIVLMLRIDRFLDARAQERELKLAPVTDLETERRRRAQERRSRTGSGLDQAPYDWKVQGL